MVKVIVIVNFFDDLATRDYYESRTMERTNILLMHEGERGGA